MTDINKAVYKDALFINAGSVWDIECHLKNYQHRYSIGELQAEIDREKVTRNRVTVIKKIEAVIKKRQKEGKQ